MTTFEFYGSFLALFRLPFIYPLPLAVLFALIYFSSFICLLFAQSVKMLVSILSHMPGKFN